MTYLVKGDNNFTYEDKLKTMDLIYDDDEDLGIKFYVTVITDDPKNNGSDDADDTPPFAPPKNPPTRSDPLVLDLDGDGAINTVNLGLGVNFDLDGDHFAEKTSWVSSQDGFLVLDINGNGSIDNGGELFGTDTLIEKTQTKASDGFVALAQHDDNDDKVINDQDAIFDRLKIWQDKNGDGISQHTELSGLSGHGIYEISTSAKLVDIKDDNQVIHVNQGAFKQSKGGIDTTGVAETLLFEVDTSNTVHVNKGIQNGLSQELLRLPDLKGYGTVKNLRIAIQEDKTGVLKTLVESFVHTPKEKHLALVHDILLHWVAKQHISPELQTHPSEGMQSQKFEILKSLWGKDTEWNH